jgi:adenylosuccinate synthase
LDQQGEEERVNRLQVVVGGQYGSEAKGAVAGYLAAECGTLVAIRVAGPNAGHSVVDPRSGTKYALRQIPVAAVTNPEAILVIAAGSEIELAVLRAEVEQLENDGIEVTNRLRIDPAATVLTPAHHGQEHDAELTARIGSTGKGIGAARADRIMRTAQTVRDYPEPFTRYGKVTSAVGVIERLRHKPRLTVQIEGTQGYGLGLHHPNYPQVTSSDCRAIDFMAMAGVSPWEFNDLEIWIVYRPYPIRVAGNSGPMYAETTWEELGLPPEYTTVTKKIRRVGHWDEDLARGAYRANGGGSQWGPVHLALTMADQMDPNIAGTTNAEALLASPKVVGMMDLVAHATGDLPEIVTTSDRTWVDLRHTAVLD